MFLRARRPRRHGSVRNRKDGPSLERGALRVQSDGQAEAHGGCPLVGGAIRQGATCVFGRALERALVPHPEQPTTPAAVSTASHGSRRPRPPSAARSPSAQERRLRHYRRSSPGSSRSSSSKPHEGLGPWPRSVPIGRRVDRSRSPLHWESPMSTSGAIWVVSRGDKAGLHHRASMTTGETSWSRRHHSARREPGSGGVGGSRQSQADARRSPGLTGWYSKLAPMFMLLVFVPDAMSMACCRRDIIIPIAVSSCSGRPFRVPCSTLSRPV